MIEKEYKRLLDKKQYEHIEHMFLFQEEFTQINFYYKEVGQKSEVTIRIREKENIKYLQIKEPISKCCGTHIKSELQKQIGNIPDVLRADVLNNLSHSSKFRDSHFVGTMITKRKIAYVEGCEIVLDRNYYFDIIDYELEVEYEKEIDQDVIDLLGKENLLCLENSEGKYSRFIRCYNRYGM